jgi:protein-S-isoprenylcysteine O-methyltransferase Ste14
MRPPFEWAQTGLAELTVTDATRGWLLVTAQFGLLAVLVLGPSGQVWTVTGPLRTAGSVLRWAGLAAIVLGVLRLGRGFSVHPVPTAIAVLRTDGLYRVVRHPIYSGVLLLAAGMAATAGSFLAITAFAFLVLVLSAKARFEEGLLAERFPDYAAYARRTPRFVPFLRPGR